MKRSVPFLILTLCASASLAQAPAALSPATQKAVSALVQAQLVQPLERVRSKRKRFSRVAPMPVARRVRLLDAVAYTDVRGKTFVRFAIDTHDARGDESWNLDAMFGCAYPNERKVFVQSGDDFVPAGSFLGGNQRAQADVCRSAPGAAVELAVAP